MFVLYLRPVELLPRRGNQILASLRPVGPSRRSLVLFPQERDEVSKTGEQDESLQLDLDFYQWMGPVLAQLKARAGDEGLVANCSYAELARLYLAAGQKLKLPAPPTLYQLRHGGASADLASGRRTIAGVKARGRWHDDRSVTRYGKGGRITEQLSRLGARFHEHVRVLVPAIGAILSGSSPPWRPVTAGR